MTKTATASGVTILVAEDLEENLFLVQSFLEELGYGVDTAINGRIAIDKASRGRYTAILMDIEMPEVDGLDATKAIRRNETQAGTGQIPIIGMTGHSSEGIKRLCTMAGMSGFISKPIRFADFEAKIRTLLAPV